MNIATFPTRDASPPLEVAFRGSVWCLRPFACFRFTRRKSLLLHVCLHLPARLPAPSLYTAAPVCMIGYTTYTFRCRGSDFLIRATETTTSRCRITALPYNFSPSHHRKTHFSIAQTASTSADAPVFPENRKKCIKCQSIEAKIPV